MANGPWAYTAKTSPTWWCGIPGKRNARRWRICPGTAFATCSAGKPPRPPARYGWGPAKAGGGARRWLRCNEKWGLRPRFLTVDPEASVAVHGLGHVPPVDP